VTAGDLPTLEDERPYVRVRAFMFERSPTHHHRGIDLPAKEGSPVYAAARGSVVHAVNQYTQGFGGYGKVVVVKADDGTYQLYAHLSRVLVNVGDILEDGAELGKVGKTQYTQENPTGLLKSGPHLHYEVSESRYPKQPEAERMDPVRYLEDGRIHPLKRYRFGGGNIPEVAPVKEGNGSAEGPFVQPVGRGLLFRLSGYCPHCSLPISANALAAGEP
jgi:hypothetical protein